jgi:hypothetical protein
MKVERAKSWKIYACLYMVEYSTLFSLFLVFFFFIRNPHKIRAPFSKLGQTAAKFWVKRRKSACNPGMEVSLRKRSPAAHVVGMTGIIQAFRKFRKFFWRGEFTSNRLDDQEISMLALA